MTPTRLIGRANGEMPWKLPEDMKLFKGYTTGKTVVMGRKTFDTIKKPLKDRRNIVISGDPGWWRDDVTVVRPKNGSLMEGLIEVVDYHEDIVIIGGGQIYTEFLPEMTELHVSTIYGQFDSYLNDVYFPEEFSEHFNRYIFIRRFDAFEYGIYTKSSSDGAAVPRQMPPVYIRPKQKELPLPELISIK